MISLIDDPMISNESPIKFPTREFGHSFVAQPAIASSAESIGDVFEQTKPKCDGCGNPLTGTECLNCAQQTIL